MLLQSCGFIFFVVAELWAYHLYCGRTVGLLNNIKDKPTVLQQHKK
jgi:hypothetical protein